ncbi:hypothetical protein M1349_01530 [Patescibacteria group bacterium]|nr:hypothetical protein [Patescibacteria group bacterium]
MTLEQTELRLSEHIRQARQNYSPDSSWSSYNSNLSEYQDAFASVLNDKKILDLLSEKDKPVVIDVMAPSGTLADMFTQLPDKKNKLGIAISLEDLRSLDEIERDESLGICQVSGDITKSKTWRKASEILNGRKADLIIERGFGGLRRLPHNAVFYGLMLQRLWQLLAVDGTMLLQLSDIEDLISAKVSPSILVRNLNEAGIKASYGQSIPFCYSSLRVEKSADSPEHLPFSDEAMVPEQYGSWVVNMRATLSSEGFIDHNANQYDKFDLKNRSERSINPKYKLFGGFSPKERGFQ